MTISGGRSTSIWTGGGVVLILAAIVLTRLLYSPGSDREAVSFRSWDSAGVEIVESTLPAWGEGEGWRVLPEPTLRIGVVDGDPAYQFNQVAQASESGLRRDPVAWVRFDVDGVLVNTVGSFPGREIYLTEEDGRGVMSTPPFGRNSVGTIRDGRVVVGAMEIFEMEELSPDGELLRIMRIPGRVEEVEAEDLEAYIQGRLATAPPERHPSIRQSLEDMPVPETLPAYGWMLSDAHGNLWVGAWANYPEVPRFRTVFDGEGRWLGDVGMPPRVLSHGHRRRLDLGCGAGRDGCGVRDPLSPGEGDVGKGDPCG